MVAAATRDMGVMDKITSIENAGSTIIRGVYENFRMLGDAVLTAQGGEEMGTHHHREMIAVLTKLPVKSDRSILVLQKLRKLRHKINYEGYIPEEEEVKYVISVKKALWKPVLDAVKKQVENVK